MMEKTASKLLMYLLTAIGLSPGDTSIVYTYTQTVIEQHNETEYTEQNIHNNENT
jgi:hypothetical protein